MFVKHFAITYIGFFYSIQDAMNRTEDLVLHQPQAENKTTQPSMNVKIWLERGTLLKKKVLEPKLMWSVLNGGIQKPMGIPLMDIYRIVSVQSVDREKYPFVKTKNAFFIRTGLSGTFLFEARNEIEKNTFIKNLKLVIARLASQVFVNDSIILKDYFQQSTLHALPNPMHVYPKPGRRREMLI